MGRSKKKSKKKMRMHMPIPINPNGMAEVPVEKYVVKSNEISKWEVQHCSYRKSNNYCLMRDDKCVPNSLKCKKNKRVFGNGSLAPAVSESNPKRTGTRMYNPLHEERYGINVKVTTLPEGTKVTLNVFKGFLNLSKKDTIDYYVHVRNIKTGTKYKIVVAYNKQTGKYYISDTQLRWLHKREVYPDVIIQPSNDGSEPLITIDFQEFSKLALYGYSAGKHGLDKSDRHKILKHVLDNDIMQKYEIIEHLQGLISLRTERTDRDFSTAIKNWREDIQFVNDYKKK